MLASLAQGQSEQAETTLSGNDKSNQKEKVSVAPVRLFGTQTVVYRAGSLLVRTRDGVYMSYQASGLTPGTAVTAWRVFFNNPRACATSPCGVPDLPNPEVQASLVNAGGRIVGEDGAADYGEFRAVGDITGARTGPGLLNAFRAEIHLVVRSHGPAMLGNPQVLREQLTVFNGGCPPNTCANLQASVHQP